MISEDTVLGIILDGQREERKLLWQLNREVSRLAHVIETQQTLSSKLMEHDGPRRESDRLAAPTLPVLRAPDAPQKTAPEPDASVHPTAAPPRAESSEVEELRGLLAQEQQLVECLRKSGLALEQRVVQAQPHTEPHHVYRGASLLKRLLTWM